MDPTAIVGPDAAPDHVSLTGRDFVAVGEGGRAELWVRPHRGEPECGRVVPSGEVGRRVSDQVLRSARSVHAPLQPPAGPTAYAAGSRKRWQPSLLGRVALSELLHGV
jgi:hypothetical protein